MLQTITGFLFVMLIMIGTVALCYGALISMIMPKNLDIHFVLMPFNEKSVNIRKKVYGLRMKLNITGEADTAKIIILDCGINKEEKENVYELCTEANGIYFVPKEKIKDFLNGRI